MSIETTRRTCGEEYDARIPRCPACGLGPEVEAVSRTSTQGGPVTVNFTVGRITPTGRRDRP